MNTISRLSSFVLILFLCLFISSCATRGIPSISATTWTGADSDGDYYVFHFKSSGELHYKSPTGFWTKATWKQTGDKVYMETNNKYSEYFGTIRGNKIKGTARNVKGKKWKWSATRQ